MYLQIKRLKRNVIFFLSVSATSKSQKKICTYLYMKSITRNNEIRMLSSMLQLFKKGKDQHYC